MKQSRRWPACAILALGALSILACYNFHLVGPEDPEPDSPPALVSVTIEYEQPDRCVTPYGCDEPVVFYGSWMREGAEFSLEPVGTTTRIWRGTALAVPVNFPPTGSPYEVRVRDPHLRLPPSWGMTSERLIVGGEILRTRYAEGTPNARAVLYIDHEGKGRNAF